MASSTAPYYRMNGHQQRKLSDYCSIFAEKTNRIGRNVENFMHSRGFFTGRRSTDESSRGSGSIARSNGDVVRMSPGRSNRILDESQRYSAPGVRRYEQSRYEQSGRRYQDRPVYSRNSYPRATPTATASSSESSYIERPLEAEPRRASRRDYSMTYEDRLAWRDVSRELSSSKPRNGINQGRIERPYSCTLPRRSRTINFRDQASSSALEPRRGYPKSLQDLTDLELDDRSRDPADSSLLSASARHWVSDRLDDTGYRRRRQHRDDEQPDPGYLKLYRNLSRLDKYPQGGRYEPGQVHYERECRTFGKDTVAFIYYKTCYL